jgi:hypothetical protein
MEMDTSFFFSGFQAFGGETGTDGSTGSVRVDEEYARGFGVSDEQISASATPPADSTGANVVYPPAGNDFNFDACTT